MKNCIRRYKREAMYGKKTGIGGNQSRESQEEAEAEKETAGSHPLFRDDYTDYADGNGIYHGEI